MYVFSHVIITVDTTCNNLQYDMISVNAVAGPHA